jgi:hypothetical protein
MKENVVVKDVEALEEAEVEQEGVVVEDVVDVAIEGALEVNLPKPEQLETLREETKITMKAEIIKETEEKENHIVDQVLIKKENVKLVTKLTEEEVEEVIIIIKEVKETKLMRDHLMDTKDKMKEVL